MENLLSGRAINVSDSLLNSLQGPSLICAARPRYRSGHFQGRGV